MLDTLQIKKCYTRALRDEELNRIGAIAISSRRNRIFALNPVKDSPLPRITFIFTPDEIMHVSAECSIPKLLFGFNSRLPSEDETLLGLQMISEYTTAITGLDFDAMNATVSLAHFANDIQLGEPGVYAAIDSTSRIKMKGLLKHVVDDTTLYFSRKSKEVRIYPKLQEVFAKGKVRPEAIEAARGNLRFEYCLLNKYGIDSHVRQLGLENSKATRFLTQAASDATFVRLFGEIDFPNLVTNERSNIELLEERFTVAKAMRLTGFLELVFRHGENCYKDSTLRLKKATYYRNVLDCRKAGVWKANRLP